MTRPCLIASVAVSAALVFPPASFRPCQASPGEQGQAAQAPLAGRPFIGLRPGDRSHTGLLAAPAVQRELGLTNSQETNLRKFYARMNELDRRLKEDRRAARRAGDQKRSDAIDERIRDAERLNQEELRGLLTPEQDRRLAQIALQLDGVFAIVRPDLAETLDLDDAQREAAGQIIGLAKAGEEEAQREANAHDLEVQAQIGLRRAELYELKKAGTPASSRVRNRVGATNKAEFEALRPQFAKARKRMDAIHKAAENDLRKLLTRKQKARLADLFGEPFDLPVLHQVDLSTVARDGPPHP